MGRFDIADLVWLLRGPLGPFPSIGKQTNFLETPSKFYLLVHAVVVYRIVYLCTPYFYKLLYSAKYCRFDMTSSRATSPAISSLLSCSQVIRVDDASETTLAPSESVSIDKEVRCEFDIDWTNIWHGSMRLEGAKLRPRYRRVVNTKAKELWIF